MNPAFSRLLKSTDGDLIGKTFEEVLPTETSGDYSDLIDHVFDPVTHAKPAFREPVIKIVGVPCSDWSCSMWAIVDADEVAAGVMIQVTDLAEGKKMLRDAAAMNEALLLSSLEQHQLREELDETNQELRSEITERKKAQEALRHASDLLEALVSQRTSELELANKELHTLTYSIAHDLRTPLRAIVSTSRILQEDAPDALDEEFTNLLKRQVHSALRLALMLEDMLQFVRLASHPMRMETIDLAEIMKEVEDEIGPRYPDRSFTFVASDPLVVHADYALMKMALKSLLDNAAKFSPEGGTITVGSQASGSYFVRDEGIGFDGTYANRLFEPFQRLVGESDFPGNGIGLANAKRIIERHGGTVGLESSPGKGSTFFFTLP